MNKIQQAALATCVVTFAWLSLGASRASGPRTLTPIEIKAAVNAHLLATLNQTASPRVDRAAPAPALDIQRDGSGPLDDRRDDDCDRPGNTQACVDVACAKLGNWGCDEQSEVTQVLRACRGNRDGGCVEKVCAKLGSWGCDEMREIESVATSCQHQRGGACVDVACGKLGNWGCDELTEATQVATACQGSYDGGACVQSVCARLGNWGCDEMSEILQVLNECNGH
jgi:hypothetical protein